MRYLQFNGYNNTDFSLREQKYTQLTRNTKYTLDRCSLIRKFCEMLALDNTQQQDEVIDRLLDFFFCPKWK